MKVDEHIEAHDLLRQLLRTFVSKAGSILDIGAGSGFLIRELAEKYHAFGCATDPFISDHEEGAVCFRSLKAREIDQIRKRFDVIYSVHSFHHFDDVAGFLQALEKTLSWDGLFILVDWKEGAQTGIMERYFRLNDVVQTFHTFNFTVLEQGETAENFYLIATLRSRLLAVATDAAGETIYPKMFGQAPYFDLYRFDKNGFHFVEKRRNIYQKTLQHEKTLDVYAEVSECQALLSKGIGKNGRRRLTDMGVKMFFEQGRVEDALKKISESLKIEGQK